MENLLDFVKKLSFTRIGGSPEEKAAAEMILQEIDLAGEEAGSDIRGEFMPFQIPGANVEKCSVTVKGREIKSVAYLRSGNIDRDCRLLYLEDALEIDFAEIGDLSDTAVLLNGIFDEETFKRLVEHNAAAFLVLQGKYYHSQEEASLYAKELRPHLIRNGKIPGFIITTADAMTLVKEEVETIHLTLKQEDVERDSQNVLAVIPGTQDKKEEIVLTAHYDSVPVGTGTWDNATGAAALLGIYRHFIAHPPKRTLRFLWCGSEELGLLGSKAYVEQNEEQLEHIKFCFNFDMCGTTLGSNRIVMTGNKELEIFVDQYCKLTGYSARAKQGVHSSDSAPFCDKGIPALGLGRGTGTAEIHTIHDLIPTISNKALEKNVDFAIRMIGDMANAAVLPVKREMPEERKKELDKYFHRDIKKEEKTENAKKE
ncbi:MAG: M20/M25/M40 family metallo-hydrolase [Lachnospiraceae bacterium]|nr:M20/M25/M40 family metallo-hydrolase [Lachnospiraceae bacterium]